VTLAKSFGRRKRVKIESYLFSRARGGHKKRFLTILLPCRTQRIQGGDGAPVITDHFLHGMQAYGRGAGVGRTLGWGLDLGVGVGRGVTVGVVLGVAVGVGVGGGVGVPPAGP
jgi:hypothetical protein